MDKFVYPSLKERLKAEYKIYLIAFVFILIADSIGQIQIPLGPGQFILFPIFYSLIMGVLSGPQVTKIMKSKEVKAASKLVVVAICPFIAKLGINAGASLETVISAGPALLLQEFGNLGTILLAHRCLRTGFPGGERKSLYLCGRRNDRYSLFRLHGLGDRGPGYLSSLCPGNGVRSRRGDHDGQRGGFPHGNIPRNGGPDLGPGQCQRDHIRDRWHLHVTVYRAASL